MVSIGAATLVADGTQVSAVSTRERLFVGITALVVFGTAGLCFRGAGEFNAEPGLKAIGRKSYEAQCHERDSGYDHALGETGQPSLQCALGSPLQAEFGEVAQRLFVEQDMGPPPWTLSLPPSG